MFQVLKGQCHGGRDKEQRVTEMARKGKDQTSLSFVGHLNVCTPQRYLPGNTNISEERV